MIVWIAGVNCVLAVVPTVLFVRNLALYRVLPAPKATLPRASVLIPARDEEENVAAAVRSVLNSEGLELEVIVLDDCSVDRTPQIVLDLAASDPRVRLETARALPEGWCGKNFACHQLAHLASHPLLIFMDADVRVSRSDSLVRLVTFAEQSGAGLVSGVPRQEMLTWMEKMIIPLIHFVLLAFLPLRRMRVSSDPAFAAACGQILAVHRPAYQASGGHAAIAGRIHDAVALARGFRLSGFRTDLFDGTDTFACRMYRDGRAVWHGFAKNAHEGLASPRLVLPATLLLFGGQVLPLLLLFAGAFGEMPAIALLLAGVGTAASLLPRLIAARRFEQPVSSAVLHSLGVSVLIGIQWSAFVRTVRRRPTTWKGRSYVGNAVNQNEPRSVRSQRQRPTIAASGKATYPLTSR